MFSQKKLPRPIFGERGGRAAWRSPREKDWGGGRGGAEMGQRPGGATGTIQGPEKRICVCFLNSRRKKMSPGKCSIEVT